jgi:copper resistance protein C
MRARIASTLAAFGLVVSMAGPALAHTDLVKSSPAEGASVAPPKTIVLTFSEKVVSAFSGFDLAMSDGKKIPTAAATSADGKIVTLSPRGSLTAGGYKLNWHAASSEDGHRTDGVVSFKVK